MLPILGYPLFFQNRSIIYLSKSFLRKHPLPKLIYYKPAAAAGYVVLYRFCFAIVRRLAEGRNIAHQTFYKIFGIAYYYPPIKIGIAMHSVIANFKINITFK